MLQLNTELGNEVINALNIIKEFSRLDSSFELPLELLSPSIYYRENSNSPEQWYLSVVSFIFTSTISGVEEETITDGLEAMQLLRDKDKDLFDHFLELGESYLHDEYNLDLLQVSPDRDDDLRDFYSTYFEDLGLSKLSFSTNLINNLKEDDLIKFTNYVPRLIQDKFELSEDFLIDIDIDVSNLTFTIWYLPMGSSEFANHIDTTDFHHSFMKLIQSKVSCP